MGRSGRRSSSPRGKFYFAEYEFIPEEEDSSMVRCPGVRWSESSPYQEEESGGM